MMNSEQLDQLLKHALSPKVEPSEYLNQKIINQIKENNNMQIIKRKKTFALVAAIFITALSITGFAASQLLSSKQVVEKIGDQKLAKAFEDKNAIELNKTVVSGGYKFCLNGIVSGKDLSEFKSSDEELNQEKTYVVLSIAKQDGSKMPDTMDKDYDKVSFFVSPLIKGQKPWQVNIFTMHGGCNTRVINGIIYKLLECDGIEMFSDRGLYLAISTGTFFSRDAFDYNEKTGVVTAKADFEGANALFDLPLDKSKADHDKAEKYLQELLNPSKETSEKEKDEAKVLSDKIDEQIKEFEEKGVVVPGSEKKVNVDKGGYVHFKYDNGSYGTSEGTIKVDAHFKEGETGSKIVSMSTGNIKSHAIQLTKDANGKITIRQLELNHELKYLKPHK